MSSSSVRRGFAALALAGGLAGVGLVFPAVGSAAPASSMPATVRAAHLSPDMPGVDIYVTSFTGTTKIFMADATYGAVGEYQQVPAGSYTFSIRRHGAAMSTPALQTWSLTAQPGYAYTAAEVGTGADHRGVVLSDNLTPPKPGYGNVRLIQAASRAGDAAQVVATNGPVVARDAAFGTSTGYAAVKAGTWLLRASGNGLTTDRAVSVGAGSVTSVILLDAPGRGIRVIDSVDAAGVRAAPKGSVDAGGGGLAGTEAHRATHTTIAGVLVLGVGIIGGGVLLTGLAHSVVRRGALRLR